MRVCVCLCMCVCVCVGLWVGVGGCRCLCVGVCVSMGVTMIVSKFVSTKSLENRIKILIEKYRSLFRSQLDVFCRFLRHLLIFYVTSILNLFYTSIGFFILLNYQVSDFHRKPECGVMTFIVACSFLCFYTFSVNHFLHYMNSIFLLHSDNSVFFFGIDESAISSNLSHWFSIST